MTTDKIKPFNDPRVQLRSAHVNGRTYGYIYMPSTKQPKKDTIILVHGFPDLSFGWRYQIPFLAKLGLDVIAIDCIGYGRTDSPSYTLGDYTFKRAADDISTFCQQELDLTSSNGQIILGGHDWGGAIVYRCAQYYPKLIKSFFSVCTPYPSPSPNFETLSQLVSTKLPNFGYQLQFSSGKIEDILGNKSKPGIRAFLNIMYGGRKIDTTSKNKKEEQPNHTTFTVEKGVLNLEELIDTTTITRSKLLSQEEMEYYVQEYSRSGLNGPLNWYRTRELNYDDELKFFSSSESGDKQLTKEKLEIKQEVLFILAKKDMALKPFMAEKMSSRIRNLTKKEVDAGHWTLWEKPDEINNFISEWLNEKVWNENDNNKKITSKL